MLLSVWKARVVYFKGKKEKQERGEGVHAVQQVPCHLWGQHDQGLHRNPVPTTPKLLGRGVLNPVLQPLELPGMQGKAETLLQHKQTGQGRLRVEQKALSEIVPPLHQTGCQPCPGLVPSPAA